MYLLDTNIVSELRRVRPHGGVVAWLGSVPENEIFISAVTAGEIQIGIETTRARDPEKAQQLDTWLDDALANFTFLGTDVSVFRCWAKLMAGRTKALAQGGMIAATAKIHGLTVATRNTRNFKNFGVRVLDPIGHR